jgi:hypothetical protein
MVSKNKSFSIGDGISTLASEIDGLSRRYLNGQYGHIKSHTRLYQPLVTKTLEPYDQYLGGGDEYTIILCMLILVQ